MQRRGTSCVRFPRPSECRSSQCTRERGFGFFFSCCTLHTSTSCSRFKPSPPAAVHSLRLIAGLAITWIHCGCPTNAPLIASHSPGFESKHVRFDVPPSQTVRQLLTSCPLPTRCHLSLTCLPRLSPAPCGSFDTQLLSQEIEYHQGLQGPLVSEENLHLHLRGFATCLDDGGALRLESWIEEARLLALESSAVFGTPRHHSFPKSGS
jgi:hypothetical protein